MRFSSVCSGIEAASVAWNPLGWHAAWFSEIEPYPCSALAHHYPDVANLGDMTTIGAKIAQRDIEAPDVFCGGTPCQAFSIAGVRKSLDDARGNLSLEFCRIANAIDDIRQSDGQQPCIVFWENVPGVLSTSDNAFGCFLSELSGASAELKPTDGRWSNAGLIVGPRRTVAWRILDAQYFGLAQRRKRVFVVASARDDIDVGQVLFEFNGNQRLTAPSRKERDGDTGNSSFCIAGNSIGRQPQHGPRHGHDYNEEITFTLTASDRHAVAIKVRGKGHYTGEHGGRVVNPEASGGHGMIASTEKTFTIASTQDQYIVTHIVLDSSSPKFTEELAAPVLASNADVVTYQSVVRRLTPRECERLQGFPDDYTLVPHRGSLASDAPRYKALGNSWPVPVVRWIGERIQNSLILSNACK